MAISNKIAQTLENSASRAAEPTEAGDASFRAAQLSESVATGKRADISTIAGDDFERNVYCVFGLPIDALDLAGAVSKLEQSSRRSERVAFVTPNVNMLCASLARPAARRAILDHDLSLADGAPLAKLAQLMGAPIKQRCAGSDLFEALRRRPGFAGRRIRVFFFGGRDGAAEAAANRLNADKSGMECVGFLNPGFGGLEEISSDEIINEINAAKPDFVVVALGAEKGNAWIERNASALTAPLISHLGAVVDFTAGGVARAPRLMQRLGLEWAWRIVQDPALWKRYWNDAATLGALMIRKAPLALAARQKPTGVAPGASTSRRAGDVDVSLSGDLLADDLGAVRQAFRAAIQTGADINLDFANAGAIDCAFLGQVLVLEKHQNRAGRALTVTNLKPSHERLMNLQSLTYARGVSVKKGAEIASDAQTA